MPAILVYWGETIENNPLHMEEDAPEFWRKARSKFHEAAEPRQYPVDAKLGLHLIEQLVEQGFDVSQSKRLARVHGEGHAFGFVHRRLMSDHVVPIVPVALNTYFPPNQPRPRRCYELGKAIRAAVCASKDGTRVGILASGGLSHFTVDEELDRGFLDACKRNDGEALSSTILSRSSKKRLRIMVMPISLERRFSWLRSAMRPWLAQPTISWLMMWLTIHSPLSSRTGDTQVGMLSCTLPRVRTRPPSCATMQWQNASHCPTPCVDIMLKVCRLPTTPIIRGGASGSPAFGTTMGSQRRCGQLSRRQWA